jgi:hypothetical protein
MAMSHAGHMHPATPAGRAACRKAMATTGEPARGTPIPRGRIDQVTDTMIGARFPRKRAGKGPQTAVQATTPRTPTRTRRARFGDVPDAFTPLMGEAYAVGWSVSEPLVNPNRDGEYSIKVRSDHGTVYAIWHDDGAIGLQWRSARTSVVRRIATVQQGMEYLRG